MIETGILGVRVEKNAPLVRHQCVTLSRASRLTRMVVSLLVPLPVNTRQLSGVHVPGGSFAGGQGDVGPEPRALQVFIGVSAANETTFGELRKILRRSPTAVRSASIRPQFAAILAFMSTHHTLDTRRCPGQVDRTFHRIVGSIPCVVCTGIPIEVSATNLLNIALRRAREDISSKEAEAAKAAEEASRLRLQLGLEQQKFTDAEVGRG